MDISFWVTPKNEIQKLDFRKNFTTLNVDGQQNKKRVFSTYHGWILFIDNTDKNVRYRYTF